MIDERFGPPFRTWVSVLSVSQERRIGHGRGGWAALIATPVCVQGASMGSRWRDPELWLLMVALVVGATLLIVKSVT